MQEPPSPKKVAGIKAIYEQLEVKKYAEEEMQKHFQKALWHLEQVQAGSERKDPLKEFAGFLQQRAT
jgi:geranylgeranyl pyrophosphate synthase